jgi:hypothetical protein
VTQQFAGCSARKLHVFCFKIHLVGIGSRDLPACRIVPQPTMLPRAHRLHLREQNLYDDILPSFVKQSLFILVNNCKKKRSVVNIGFLLNSKLGGKYYHCLSQNRDSVVGIATCYGRVRVRVPVGWRIFSSPRHQNRLWDPPSLLSNGYRGLSGKGQGVKGSSRGHKLSWRRAQLVKHRDNFTLPCRRIKYCSRVCWEQMGDRTKVLDSGSQPIRGYEW